MAENNKSYGIVLAGGGAKGAYEAGALKALKEMGLLNNIAAVAGTSIGAVNAAFLASDTLEKAENQWKNIKMEDFLEPDDTGFDISDMTDGAFSRESLRRIIRENADLTDMSNAKVSYYLTVSTLLEDGTKCPIYAKMNGKDEGLILDYIMASSAIPKVFDNVTVEGKQCFDGGLCDNTPIRPVYDEGITDIIVISNDSEYKVLPIWDRATIYPIVPSRSLDMDTLIGTADLSRSNAYYRFELGYMDAKAIMSALLAGKNVPDLSGNHNLAMQFRNKDALECSVNRNMSGLARILGTDNFL